MVEEGYFLEGRCRNGWPKVMLELLVLASLQILGSGCTFDLAEEFTNVSSITIREFFQQKFCCWGERIVKADGKVAGDGEGGQACCGAIQEDRSARLCWVN